MIRIIWTGINGHSNVIETETFQQTARDLNKVLQLPTFGEHDHEKYLKSILIENIP